MTSLERLLSGASAPLSEHKPEISEDIRVLAGILADDLLRLLQKCNGFYAFESALHVFPSYSDAISQEISLGKWNEELLWRSSYNGLADRYLFFAEDIFGGQFCIKDDAIYTFDPETGDMNYLADDIESWAKAILNDYEVLTGYPLAHQWQEKYGSLLAMKRLLPKIPFVMGGAFSLDNLYLADAVEGMKFRANIANQIKNLPNGSLVKLDIVD
jgi:hypothetical protein